MPNLVRITINLCLDRKNRKAVKKIRNPSHLQTNQWRIEITVTFAKMEETLYAAIIVQGPFILNLAYKIIARKINLFMKKCLLKMMIQNGIVPDASQSLKKEIKRIRKSSKE